ncbi:MULTISPECIES: OsmC family protein [Tatumella]|uniref:OsmC family protein n=1 Tax=Tatumella punctata TaxID=399969 RepID=A0ABW1VMS6_9GAMM|nr:MULTISPECIES: OsmC family protein [unclassified Tatumella]MBS0855490.1 OsmC family protein [Tatumella sp. JGM16]MBS0893277.1 OsmC family protein [Tatumella sp. JGM130]MBS0912267.1 OsmC family protein [Tatumella sp. JGM91]
MAIKQHHYQVTLLWTGNRGEGTASYKAYDRSAELHAAGRDTIALSADPAFRGDKSCWNPEQLLLASVSACHKLWYLHLCADAGVVVDGYQDNPEGTMVEGDRGHFTQITLRPEITLRNLQQQSLAADLHHKAHEACFIANSLNFPVNCEPVFLAGCGADSAPAD